MTAAGLGALQLAGKADKVPAVLGSVSSWVTAGGVTGILALLIWLQLGNRKLNLEERSAENADKADIRDHYAEEVSTLRERFDAASARHSKVVAEIESKYRKLLQETEEHYKSLLSDSEQAHEVCKKDRDALREEVNQLRDEVRGLRDQIRTQASDRVLALGDPAAPRPSEDVMESAKRVKRHVLRRGADRPRRP